MAASIPLLHRASSFQCFMGRASSFQCFMGRSSLYRHGGHNTHSQSLICPSHPSVPIIYILVSKLILCYRAYVKQDLQLHKTWLSAQKSPFWREYLHFLVHTLPFSAAHFNFTAAQFVINCTLKYALLCYKFFYELWFEITLHVGLVI